jgi:hypothetical protein
LRQPRRVYRPFTRDETRILRNYVSNARELAEMRFFKQVPNSFTVAGEVPFSMDEPDSQDTRAAMALLRQLYTPSEPTSAAVVLNLLKKSAHEHGGPSRDAAISELRDLGSWTREIVAAGTGIGIVFDHGETQRPIRPAEILDAYFHGKYLHGGNDLSDVVLQLDEIGVPRFTLYNVMRELARAYYVVANVVGLVLAVPELLDADSEEATHA